MLFALSNIFKVNQDWRSVLLGFKRYRCSTGTAKFSASFSNQNGGYRFIIKPIYSIFLLWDAITFVAGLPLISLAAAGLLLGFVSVLL